MHACGLLTPENTIIIAHANAMSPSDIALVKKSGVHISSTPSVELQLGLGTPACFDPTSNLLSHSSLGVDCHNVVLASIVGEMRCTLVNSRGAENDRFLAAGKMRARINHTVQEAYALGTIQGARAVGMESQIGSLALGKKADIIIFDALAPAMICGAQYDPITAIVMHSTPGDIVMTFVDGILRKNNGKLLSVSISAEDAKTAGVEATTLSWHEIGKNLLRTQAGLQAKMGKLNLEAAKPDALAAFGIDASTIMAKL